MHISIEGLDGAGKTRTAGFLAEKLGFTFCECPIYDLVGRDGVMNFCKNKDVYDERVYADIAALFYGAGNLGLRARLNENIITDRHICSTYMYNQNERNAAFFDALAELCGKPALTVILYASPEERRRRKFESDPNDPDLKSTVLFDEACSGKLYDKALEFVKKYGMEYIWVDNTPEEMNLERTADEIINACRERRLI